MFVFIHLPGQDNFYLTVINNNLKTCFFASSHTLNNSEDKKREREILQTQFLKSLNFVSCWVRRNFINLKVWLWQTKILLNTDDPTLKTMPGSGHKLHKVRFYSRLEMDEESHAAWMKSKQLLSSCVDRSISMTTELTPSADGREARVLSCWGQLCVLSYGQAKLFTHTAQQKCQ